MPAIAAAPTPPVPCRSDCRFFSSYTTTCDYSLMMYHTRGCPRDACTRYIPRRSAGPVMRVEFELEDGLYYEAKNAKEEKLMYVPEPPVTPPEDEHYVTAGCGHEVYDGEELFEWENGQTLCADCLSDRFGERSIVERAELLGCDHQTVCLPPSTST